MSREIEGLDIDDFVRRYAAGESTVDISRVYGVSPDTVRSRLVKAGVTLRKRHHYIRRNARRRDDIDTAAIVSRFDEGTSVLALAREFNVSRPLILRVLREAGRETRSVSQANKLRMARMSFDERAANAGAANAARRKNRHSFSGEYAPGGGRPGRAVNAARTRASTLSALQPAEISVADALAARGIACELQVQQGPYNLDLTVGPIAVEIHTAPYNPSRHARLVHRSVHLIQAGWSLLYVWITAAHPFGERSADKVVAYLERMQSSPSPVGEQWVIRGSGDLVAVLREDPDHGALVPAPEHRRRRAAGDED